MELVPFLLTLATNPRPFFKYIKKKIFIKILLKILKQVIKVTSKLKYNRGRDII